jgi:acetyl-CoA carboxylase biotin carboxyl carrier protein
MEALTRLLQLSAWLADTDIGVLELRGPQTRLRLVRDGAGGGELVRSDVRDEVGSYVAPAQPGATVVAAPTVGIVRHRHPMRDATLASPGMRIDQGQALALLQIGHLLVHVEAPRAGVVARLLAPDGAAAGYGAPLIALTD